MKNMVKLSSILLGLFLIAGCSQNKNTDQKVDTVQSSQSDTSSSSQSDTSDTKVYENLIAANEKYGSNKDQICKSNFKCEPSEISENVVIAPTWEVDIFKNHVDNVRQIAGPTGHGYTIYELSIGNKKVTYITTGVGACNLMDAVLALGCTPCKNILFIGAVGALNKNMKIGDIVIPEYSICGVGTDRYLTSGTVDKNDSYGKKYYPNKELSDKVLKVTNESVKNKDIKVHMGKVFSCDTIFAEYAHLDEFMNMGCDIVEMETATLFNVANIVGIKASSVCSISDNTIANKSLYNGRTDDDQKRRASVKKDIIPKIVLDTLLK